MPITNRKIGPRSVLAATGLLAAVLTSLSAAPALAGTADDRSAPATSTASTARLDTTANSGRPGTPVTISAAAEIDEAGTFAIWNGLSLQPGASAVGHWNNTPQGNSYFVDVRPTATTVTTACQMQVTRTWRVQNWNADNTRELEIWWEVKNVGSAACKADVHLAYVR